MWDYYCEKCKKKMIDDEVEFLEYGFEGEYEACCIYCETELKASLTLKPID